MQQEILTKTIQEWVDTCIHHSDCIDCPFKQLCLGQLDMMWHTRKPKEWDIGLE